MSAPVRVVLVDDVEDVRRVVHTALRRRGGFEVVGEARTGAEAIELAGRERPDLVVLDLALPDLAGADVLAGIRERSPATQVVVHSAHEPGNRAWFEERTAGYVVKDAEVDYLVELVENVGGAGLDARSLRIARHLGAGTEARELVRRAVVDWGFEAIADTAFIVATELVVNAITHAGESCLLELSRVSGAMRVEVTDAGGGTPEPQAHDIFAEGGRGVVLVASMSTSWGVEAVPGGKRVWAEIALP